MDRILIVFILSCSSVMTQGYTTTLVERDYDPYTPLTPLMVLEFKTASSALTKEGVASNNMLLNQVIDLRSSGRLNDFFFRIRGYGDKSKSLSLAQNMTYATSRAEKVAQMLTTYGVAHDQIKISASTEQADLYASDRASKVEIYLVPEDSLFSFLTAQDIENQTIFNTFISILLAILTVRLFVLEKRLSRRY